MAAGARATWVWDRPDVTALLAFVAPLGVRDLFVSTPGDLGGSPELEWFRSLRQLTAYAGIRVHALGAELSWLDDHAAALAWQRQALATGLFDGVHLDVEPWAHPDWGSASTSLLATWVELLRRLAVDASCPVEADVPFWLHEHAAWSRPADELVVSAVDGVTVLSYRVVATGPDSITEISRPVSATARRLGRPVRLAVETRDLGSDPAAAKQTFHGSSRAALARALTQVDEAVDGPSHAGIAVHDHLGWTALRP